MQHLGPHISGKSLELFVIMLRRNEDDPICVLNTSAQLCKMGVDFYFEKERGSEEDYICTLFVEGQAVADGKGGRKTVKLAVADRALKCLSKMCHTVIAKDFGFNKGSVTYRKDIKNEGKLEDMNPKTVEECVSSEVMKMMGWEEGEGLGGSSVCIVEPLKAKEYSIREGMGSKAIDCDSITREEATEIIERYVKSNSVEELIFSSELSIDEGSEIKMLTKRYNLLERTVVENNYGRKKTLLVLSKKIGPGAIIEQLEKEGRLGTHQLVRPRDGDR